MKTLALDASFFFDNFLLLIRHSRAISENEVQKISPNNLNNVLSNYTYNWSPGGETTSSITAKPTTTTTYTVDVTSGTTTCQSDVTISVNQRNLVTLDSQARAPYGERSFEVVNQYTLEAVEFLFNQNCPIVILACNTSSAKALRNIQKNILPYKFPDKKVLGVIRPTTEEVGHFTKSGYVGIMGTALIS